MRLIRLTFPLFISFLLLQMANAQNHRSNTKKLVPYRSNYQRLESGSNSNHTLEIRNGYLWAWGAGGLGQLGDGSATSSAIPIQIGNDSTWVLVSTANAFSHGIKADGTLWGWGRNVDGGVGDGTTIQRNTPVQVGTGNNWVSVSAGSLFCIGLKSDGTIWTWGANQWGQLGNGTIVGETSPIQVGIDNKWVSIFAGTHCSMAIKSDGTLWAWGGNQNGELGDGTTTQRNSPIQIGSDNKWVSLSPGLRYTLGIKANGTLWSWGLNANGQLGNGTIIDSHVPIQIGLDNKWVTVEVGNKHSHAIKSDGTLWSWGYNAEGQNGDGTTTEQHFPVQVGTDNTWVALSAGNFHVHGLKANGTLWGWGSGGLIGDGTNTNRSSPVAVGTVPIGWLSSFGVLGHSTLGIRSNGTLWGWGENGSGELGDGTTTNRSNPVQAGLDTKWICVSSGLGHSLGLKSDGTLWSWGYNNYGQLGDGTTTNRLMIAQVGSDNKWVSVAAGLYTSIGLKSDGTLWAWGSNIFGEVGDGTTMDRLSPVQIGTGTTWVAVTKGAYHALAIKADGTLWTWGYNAKGQIGDGTQATRSIPVQVGTDNKWVGVAGAAQTSVAIKSNGTLWGWGDNVHGEVGDGTGIDRHLPVQIGTDNKWIAVDAGYYHVVGLKSDGTHHGWGRNMYGELGDGTNVIRYSPVQAGSDHDWVVATAGTSHSIGLKSTRIEYCGSGINQVGQLGNGTLVDRNTYGCETGNCTPPTAPVSSGTTICSGTTATLTATILGSGGWYSAPTGGTYLGSGSSFTTPPLTSTTTYYVQDSTCATSGSRTAVTVTIDATPPAITCPGGYSVSNDLNSCSAVVSYTAPIGTDNCPSAVTVQTAGLASGASFPVGVTTNTFRVTDGAGNSTTCSFTVTVNDSQVPSIICNSNVSVSASANQCSAVVSYPLSSSDNCSGQTVVQTGGLASGASFPVGVTTNTFLVFDGTGNSNTCSFTVTVNDGQVPAITCNNNVSINASVGSCSETVTYSAPSGTDNCSGATTMQVAGLASGGSFPVGVTTNTFQVTDGAGNAASCSFTVTVHDNQMPAITCNSNVSVNSIVGACSETVIYSAPSGTDNCSGATTMQVAGLASGATFPVGVTTNTFQVTDGAGNSTSCSFTVTVNDNESPTAICQGVIVTLDSTGNGSTTASVINNGSTDNCAVASQSLSANTFTCANAGVNTVTLMVTDPSGNTATCLATVTVVAQPVTLSVTSTVAQCGYNISCSGATDGIATATGNGGCPGYSYRWSNGQNTATSTGMGAGTYLVTVTDIAGGTAVQSVTLTSPMALSATATVTPTCTGESDGSIDLTVTGGNACQVYGFAWSNGAISEDISGLPAGSYTVTITDVVGCMQTLVQTISALPLPQPTYSQVGNLLTSTQAWSSYQWLLNGGSIVGANGISYSILQTGTYSLSVTDSNGCVGVSDTSMVVGTDGRIYEWSELLIYPNPARCEFRLQTLRPMMFAVVVQVTDMYGKHLFAQDLPQLDYEAKFDIGALAAGTYLVEVTLDAGMKKVFRLVVQ